MSAAANDSPARLIAIDWGQGYTNEPSWRDWFQAQGLSEPFQIRPALVYSLSGLALEAAVAEIEVKEIDNCIEHVCKLFKLK